MMMILMQQYYVIGEQDATGQSDIRRQRSNTTIRNNHEWMMISDSMKHSVF